MKVCRRCEEEKEDKQFETKTYYNRVYNMYRTTTRKVCRRCMNKTYDSDWRERNKERFNAYQANLRRREASNLVDSYVRYIITKNTPLSMKDVPQNMVNLKRKQLKLLRHVKKVKAGRNKG